MTNAEQTIQTPKEKTKVPMRKGPEYVGQMTRCRVCGKPVRVKSTITTKMDNGKMLITRKVQCTDRHRHTYSIRDTVDGDGKKAPASSYRQTAVGAPQAK